MGPSEIFKSEFLPSRGEWSTKKGRQTQKRTAQITMWERLLNEVAVRSDSVESRRHLALTNHEGFVKKWGLWRVIEESQWGRWRREIQRVGNLEGTTWTNVQRDQQHQDSRSEQALLRGQGRKSQVGILLWVSFSYSQVSLPHSHMVPHLLVQHWKLYVPCTTEVVVIPNVTLPSLFPS